MKKITIGLLLFCLTIITTQAQNNRTVTDENYQQILAKPMEYPLMQVWKAYEQKQDYKLRHDFSNTANKESEIDNEEFEGEDALLLRSLRFYMDRLDSNGMIVPWNIKAAEAYREYKATQTVNKLLGGVTANWSPLGPLSGRHPGGGIGRIDCMAVDPTNDDIMYAGSFCGGLWKTINKGLNWNCITNSIAEPVGVASIVIDNSTNPHTLYFASGDRDGGTIATFFNGVFKSTDDGLTWSKSTSGISPTARAYKLLMHPVNHSNLLFLTRDKLYKSIDAGVTWTTSIVNSNGATFFSSDHPFLDMVTVPGEPDKILILAQTNNATKQELQIFSSNDFGSNNSFSSFLTPPFNEVADGYKISNAKLAVHPTVANKIYVAFDQVAENTVYGKLKIWDNQNSHWVEKNKNIFDKNKPPKSKCDNNLLGNIYSDEYAQTYYCFTLDIDPELPANPDNAIIYIGGIILSKSTDGGLTFEKASNDAGNNDTYTHADQHSVVFNSAKQLISGNDGGVYLRKDKTNNGKWEFISNGLMVSTIYNSFIDNSIDYRIWSALQDNGSGFINENSEKIYIDRFSGDGLEISKTNNKVYGIAQERKIKILDISNLNATENPVPVKVNEDCANSIYSQPFWNSSILTTRLNSNQVVLGSSGLYYTENAGTNWKCVFNTPIPGFNSSQTTLVRKIERSLKDPKKVYAVMQIIDGGKGYSHVSSKSILLVSNKSGKDFKVVSGPKPPKITAIAVGRWNNKEVVFGSCAGIGIPYTGNKVFVLEDNIHPWTNISTGLPDISVNCIVYDTTSIANDIYVGTDMGVFYRNEKDDWVEFNTDMPKCLITDLDIDYNNHTLVASTYGRGLWQCDLVSAHDVEIESEGGFTMCGSGENLDLKAVGANGIAYLWDDNSTNRTRTINGPGTYSVTVTLQNSATVTSTATASIKIGSEADQFFVHWEKTYTDGGNDQKGVGIVSEDNRAYFVANTSKNSSPDIFIGAINDRGKLLWQKTMGGPKGDFAGGLCLSQKGILMIGATSSGSGSDVPTPDIQPPNIDMNWIFKLDASTGIMMKKTNNTDFNFTYDQSKNNNELSSIKKGPGDEIYYANSFNSKGVGTNKDFNISKINGLSGVRTFVGNYSARYNDYIRDMAFVSNNGQNKIYVTGEATFDDSLDVYSTFSGAYWPVRFGNVKSFTQMFLYAPHGTFSNKVGWTIGIKVPSNSIFCNSVFAGENPSYGSAITGSLDNNIYLTGQSSCVGFHMATVTKFGGDDIYVRKQKLAGDKHSWVNSAGGSQNDYSKDILTTIDNGVIIAGGTNSNNNDCIHAIGKGNGDIFLASFDNTGVKTGTEVLGSTGFDEATSLAWDADSASFYLCGTTTNQAGDADVYIAKLTTFTCPIPYKNLGTIDITKNSATLKWDKRPCNTAFEVYYRKANSTDVYNKIALNGEQQPVAGLTENTEYEWKVRSKCADGNYSIFSPLQYFTTLSTRDGVALTPHVDFEANLYPNPNSGNFSVALNVVNDGVASLTILDGTGRIVGEKSVTVLEGENLIDYTDIGLAQGIYFVRVAIGGQAKIIRVSVY